MDPFDRSLLANADREKLLRSGKILPRMNIMVWVQGKDGKVFGSLLEGWQLQPNGISGGNHHGLLWWPYTQE